MGVFNRAGRRLADRRGMETEWQEGYSAYRDGRDTDSCPYPKGSDAYEAWRAGYSEAVFDDQTET